MRQTKIDGITVNAPEDINPDELLAYVKKYKGEYLTLTGLDIEIDGDYANITVHSANRPFERIRRVTGYLVGTMSRWNDAKRAEERDRVKHSL